MERRTIIVVVLSALAIAVAALVGAGSKDSGSTTPSTQAVETAPANAAAAPVDVPAAIANKPVPSIPGGNPPTTLVSRDIVLGTGAAAKSGDALTMRYLGVDWTTKKVFDASWNGDPNEFQFSLGGGSVIPCWDEGVVGMKVGGRRQLTCPPDTAYGANGQGSIGPNATLVFVVDLLKVG
jgi:peptidylprolyl isomerase